MKKIFVFLMLFLVVSCKRKLTSDDIKEQLSNAMLRKLWLDKKMDTSNFKFQILDVNYYENVITYDAEFKVRMHVNSTGFDTVGIMAVNISKDFNVVKRKY